MSNSQKYLRPPFKIHGGKRYLKNWLIKNLPKNYQSMDYAEPFCGACSVLLNKPKSKKEYLNDLDFGVYAILKTIQSNALWLTNKLKDIEYNQDNFLDAKCNSDDTKDLNDRAVLEYVARRMSRGGLKEHFSWSSRERGGMPGDVHAYLTSIDQISHIADRIEDVEISNLDAQNFVTIVDNDNIVFYCDPTYLPSTRKAQNTYKYELSQDDHIELAQVLNSCKGNVMISGYPSKLYDEIFQGWNKAEYKIANHSSQRRVKEYRTEVVWKNY